MIIIPFVNAFSALCCITPLITIVVNRRVPVEIMVKRDVDLSVGTDELWMMDSDDTVNDPLDSLNRDADPPIIATVVIELVSVPLPSRLILFSPT